MPRITQLTSVGAWHGQVVAEARVFNPPWNVWAWAIRRSRGRPLSRDLNLIQQTQLFWFLSLKSKGWKGG